MSSKYRMSKYNHHVFDECGNLILFNFLTGLKSLFLIKKDNVEEFLSLFSASDIEYSSNNALNSAIDQLIDAGILVYNGIEESIYCDSSSYEDIFNSELVLTILPTGKCNFNCPYCFESDKQFSRSAMSLENQNALLKYVQKNISKHKSLKVGWFGGEPLLEPNIIKYLSEKIIKICNARFLPYSSEMTTNGYFLTEEVFKMLYSMKVYNYQITIDGVKEHHDKYRTTHNGKGTYDVIFSNLLRIKDLKQYKFARILLRVNMLKDSVDKTNEFIDLFYSTFGDDHRFSITFMPVADFSNENNRTGLEKTTAEDINKILSANEIYTNKIFNEKEARIASLLPQRKCVSARKNTYVIAPDLSVYKCCIYFDHPSNKIGFISPTGDLVVNENKHRQWFTTNKLYTSCNDCFYYPVCKSTACPIRMNKKRNNSVCQLKDEDFYQKISDNIIYASKCCDCKQLNLS